MDPLLGGGSADMRKATTMSDTMRTIGFIGAWVVLITTLLQFAPELLRKQRGRFGLEPGEFVPAGQEIESSDGRHVLRMERDGNLVLREARVVTWSSGTSAPNSILVVDDDGTMVVEALDGTPMWSSATDAVGPDALEFDDGTMQVCDAAANIRRVLPRPVT
jgi:hypothetical protein